MAAHFKTLSGVTEFGIYEMSALRKTTLEEWGGVYAGVRATPTPSIYRSSSLVWPFFSGVMKLL